MHREMVIGKTIYMHSERRYILSHAQSIVVMLFENWPRFVFFFDHQSIIFAATDGVRLKTFTA